MASPEPSAPPQAPAAGTPTNQPKRKRHWLLPVSAIIVIAVAAGGAAYWLAPSFFAIPLVSQTVANSYSIDTPEDYHPQTSGNITRFTEPNGSNTITSSITVSDQPLPSMLVEHITAEKRLEQLKTTAQIAIGDALEDKYKVTNVKLSQAADRDGHKVYRGSADLTKDGKSAGGAKIAIVITDKRIYAITVAADNSNTTLLRQAGHVLDSFDPKK